MRLINLTPHELAIYDEGTTVLRVPPSGQVARCEQHENVVEVISVDGHRIAVLIVDYGEVEGLPQPEAGTRYVVSRLVAEACRDRRDLLIPGPGIRDDQGRIVGCRGLARI